MADRTTILKIAFTLSAIFFLFVFVSAPKTHCQACKFEYEGKSINGHVAYDIYEEACIRTPVRELEPNEMVLKLSDQFPAANITSIVIP